MAAKGHPVRVLNSLTGDEVEEMDLVLGPNMWRMGPDLTKYIDAAIKGTRISVYPK